MRFLLIYFFLRYNIVCFGVSGVSIVLSEFGVNPSMFIMIAYLVLLVVSYFFLGIDDVKNQIVGTLIYPVFIEHMLYVTEMINFGNLEIIVIAVMGGILAEII